MWLVAHMCSWAVDSLASRGLPHPDLCPLCDQEFKMMKISNTFSWIVFLQGNFVFFFLQYVGLDDLAPQPKELSFDEWWERVEL